MSSILRPGYVRWDGLKYVLDPDIEIVGPIGPPGEDGSAGPPGPAGGGGDLIYRPGGTTTGNVFATWTGVMAKRVTIDGPVRIVIDDSIITPAPIDAGIWDLTHNTALIGSNGFQNEFNGTPLTALNVEDGGQLLDPNAFYNLAITGASTTIPSIETIGVDNLNFEAWNCTFLNQGFSSIPLIHTSGGVIDLYGACHIISSNNSSFVIEGNDGYLTLNVNDQSFVDGYSLKLDPTNKPTIHVTGGGYFEPQQNGISVSALSIVQQNPVQAAPRDNFTSANPNLIVIRRPFETPPIATNIGGAINFGTEDPGFSYENGAPNTQGVNADFATVLGGTNNDIDADCVFCVIAGGSGNIFNSSGGGNAPTWGYISGRDNKITGPGTFSAIVGGENNTIDTSNTCFILGRNSTINSGSNNCVIVGGDSNGISGNASRSIVAGGVQNFVTGGQGNGVFAGQNNTAGTTGLVGAVVLGGDLNNASDESCAVVAGEQNAAAAQFSVVVGGNQNQANSLASIVVGGHNNSVNDSRAVIVGGINNIVNPGVNSVVLGGNGNNISAPNATVMGNSSKATLQAQFSHGSGGNGGSQFSRYMVFGQSSGTTPLILLDASNSSFIMQAGVAYAIKATCIANRTGTAGRAMFVHTLLVHQSGGTVVIDNDNTTLSVPNGQTWTIVFSPNGNSLRATFTGTAAHVVNIMVTYEWSEVGGGV